ARSGAIMASMTAASDTTPESQQDTAHQDAAQQDAQPLAERVNNRSQRPSSQAFREFIADGWAPRPDGLPERSPAADYAAARREAIGRLFPGERLVIPAGQLLTRSN